MRQQVIALIRSYALLEKDGLYVVALSGGADSVALLHLLHSEGYHLHAAHCNFHLRGAESDRDEHFCQALCERLGIPLHLAHFATQEYAEAHHVSIEMAARELRYKWFGALREDLGASGICVAHHRDDNVETVFLNLLRGTGLRGLTGMQPRNGYILRPLLRVSRADITEYLSEHHQNYVTDSTNLEADVLRNRIRLQVLPLLKELNPAVSDNICRTIDNLTEVQKVLAKTIPSFKECMSLSFKEIRQYGSTEYVLHEWLRNYGFNGSQIRQIDALVGSDEMAVSAIGTVFTSSQGYDLLIDRNRLLVEPSFVPVKTVNIPETGYYLLDKDTHLRVSLSDVTDDFQPSRLPRLATLDADKVKFPLTVRPIKIGDKMQPFGMKGHKLLSDLMTDDHMSLFEKRRQRVVVDADGRIVWLVALRTDHRFRITSHTRRVLVLKIE